MKKNHSLKEHNTFNVTAYADYFYKANSIENVQQLIGSQPFNTLPKLILGGGSNILFTQDFKGLVIQNHILGITPVREDEHHVWLRVGAGENWHQFVLYCIERNYAGVENLSLIPGTVGAAPIQNIGAYGVEFESVFESLQALHLTSGAIKKFSHHDCELGYRDSIFKRALKNHYLITEVTVKLSKQPKINSAYGDIKNRLDKMNITQPTIHDISQAVIGIRSQKLPDPKKLPNAGSFFKNPVLSHDAFQVILSKFPNIPHFKQANNTIKIPAAWLIEQCQLKGFKKNGVGTSPHHALVIVNYDSAHGKAIQQLAEEIQKTVADKFNIQLETEVNIF